MACIIGWGTGIAASAALLTLLAAGGHHYWHAGVSALTAIVLALLAIQANEKAVRTRQSAHMMGSINACHMASVWGWGTLALIATYTMAISWKEWWQFTLAFGAATIISMVFARLLKNPGGNSQRTAKLMNSSRILAKVQLVGMIITMLGLLIDSKMDFEDADWAGNNVFFFGAGALAVMSWIALGSYSQASEYDKTDADGSDVDAG